MPVHNAQDFVGKAIESILGQSFCDFEFLIFNDCSSDESEQVISSYTDPRIRYIKNAQNLGVARTLNQGLGEATGEYVVRMDGDDISHKHRLAKQVDFMDHNASVGISGTWITLFGDQPRLVVRSPVGSEVVRSYMVFDNPLFHPTVIIRKKILTRFHLQYDPMFDRTEDYHLWSRAMAHCQLDNIPEPLLFFRHHKSSVTRTNAQEMARQTGLVNGRLLLDMGLAASEAEIAFHRRVSRGERLDFWRELLEAERWFIRIEALNRRTGHYQTDAFSCALGMVWFRLCLNSTPLGPGIWRRYRDSPLAGGYKPSKGQFARFGLSVLWNSRFRLKGLVRVL